MPAALTGGRPGRYRMVVKGRPGRREPNRAAAHDAPDAAAKPEPDSPAAEAAR
jgi:hypothetical protein